MYVKDPAGDGRHEVMALTPASTAKRGEAYNHLNHTTIDHNYENPWADGCIVIMAERN